MNARKISKPTFQKTGAGRPAGDAEAQKQRVVEAAWRVIGEHGLERASLRAIAKELGATTGVISHYFLSKRELLLFAVSAAFDDLDARLEAAARRKPAKDALKALALAALPSDDRSRLEWSVYLSFLSQAPRDEEFQREISRRAATMRSLAKGIVERGAADGTVDGRSEPDAVIDALQAAVEGMGLLAVVEPERFPAERQQTLISNLVARLTAARP